MSIFDRYQDEETVEILPSKSITELLLETTVQALTLENQELKKNIKFLLSGIRQYSDELEQLANKLK